MSLANWPFNKINFFASEAPGFKETFRLIPILYPLPSCETVPLKWQSFCFLSAVRDRAGGCGVQCGHVPGTAPAGGAGEHPPLHRRHLPVGPGARAGRRGAARRIRPPVFDRAPPRSAHDYGRDGPDCGHQIGPGMDRLVTRAACPRYVQYLPTLTL